MLIIYYNKKKSDVIVYIKLFNKGNSDFIKCVLFFFCYLQDCLYKVNII